MLGVRTVMEFTQINGHFFSSTATGVTNLCIPIGSILIIFIKYYVIFFCPRLFLLFLKNN